MRHLLLTAALTALAFVTSAPIAWGQNVVGRYEVQGTNLNGTRYGGVAQVTALSDTTCTIVWQTGPTTSRGICMRQGDVFVASYRLGEGVGLAVYRWRNGNEYLEGTWTVTGQSGTGAERLVPMR